MRHTITGGRALLTVMSLLASHSAAVAATNVACPDGTTDTLQVGASTLCLKIQKDSAPRHTLLRGWVDRSAHIVADYYARFPAPTVMLHLESQTADGVGGGRTTNEDGLAIRVRIGEHTSSAALTDDWVLVHEMIHLALPEIGRRHLWLAEGLAVYVEGIARAQAGNRSVADVWAESRHSMPMGLPRDGEGGMDETATWARTYWGGALFCLQADVDIRRETGNQRGLQTALRAILRQTGGYGAERSIEETLRIGDAATGTHVLQELYARVKATPVPIDLDALWRQLGVPNDPKTEAFDEQAPLAAIRRAITHPLP